MKEELVEHILFNLSQVFSTDIIVFLLLFITTLLQKIVAYETNSKYIIYICIELMVIA